MRILLVGTLKRPVTLETTASRSTIIFQLGKALAEKGHAVGLLGTEDSSIPGVTIHPVTKKSFSELGPFENAFYAETSILVVLEKKIEEIAVDYDVIHNHTYPEFINLFASERITTPFVTTLHAQATPEYDQVLSLFPSANLVALSKAHKNLFHKTKPSWIVYNGIDTNRYAFQEKKEGYLLWLGRLGKAKDATGNFIDAKGVKWAIKLAQDSDSRLVLSGSVEDMDFYEQDVKPHLSDKIQWYGPVTSEQVLKREEVVKLMQRAKAFLMTINWEEPFGLVMAEAQSCGTPVIGFNKGSVPELVVDGKTGFVVDRDRGIEGLVEAFQKLNKLSDAQYLTMEKVCRKHVEDTFSVKKMVENYEKVYNQLCK